MDHSSMDHHDMHHNHHLDLSAGSNSIESSSTSPLVMDPDHSGHDMHHHDTVGGHGMMMAFHWGCNETILFDQWKISTPSGLIASMFGIFLLAALYEGLKYYREYLFWKAYNDLHYRSIPATQRVNSIENNRDNSTPKVCDVLQKQPASMLMFSMPHLFQSFLHMLQITLSFLLMLIFMTYNVWLCIAVVLGAACGYFLFGWKKSVIVDVTEHCH